MAIGLGAKHKQLYTALSLMGTVVLMMWAWRGVSFASVWNALNGIQYGWIGLGLLTFAASFLVRAHRWGILLSTQPHSGSFKIRRAAVFIGFAANQILPANAGELLRASLLSRSEKISLGAVLGSLLTARLLDAVVAFLLMLTPLIALAPSGRATFSTLPILWLGIILFVLCIAFWMAANYTTAIAQLVGYIAQIMGLGRFRSRLVTNVKKLLSGLKVLQFPKRTAIAVADTIFIWSLSGITFWVVLIAFGITKPGLSGALFIQSVEAMATILPSSPGHLGAFEAAIRFALGVYDIAPDIIVAYTLVLRIIIFGSLMTIGIAHAISLGLTGADFFSQTSAPTNRIRN